MIERYGGAVDKCAGDNIMAHFGAPVSHEDDPERAIRAALAMQAALAAMAPEFGAAAPGMRIGAAAGTRRPPLAALTGLRL